MPKSLKIYSLISNCRHHLFLLLKYNEKEEISMGAEGSECPEGPLAAVRTAGTPQPRLPSVSLMKHTSAASVAMRTAN